MGLSDEPRWLDVLADGDEAEEPDDRFTIRDDSVLEWALRKVSVKKRRIRANAERADEEIARLNERIARIRRRLEEINGEDVRGVAFLESHIRAYAESRKKDWVTKRSKTRKFLNGSISWSAKPKGLEWTDEKKLLAWAQKTNPAKFVRIQFEPAKAEIKKHFEVTGEVPDGAEPKPETDSLSIEVEET